MNHPPTIHVARRPSIAAATAIALLNGCTIPPKVASFVQSPAFEPASVERVALLVREAGADGGSPAARDVTAGFTRALIARGYAVVRGSAGRVDAGGWALPLTIEIEQHRTSRERRESTVTRGSGDRAYQQTVYTTFYIARSTVRGEIVGRDGGVVWSSDHTATCESSESADVAQRASVQTAASMVAAAIPYRRLPIDKHGRPYDPRVTAPPR